MKTKTIITANNSDLEAVVSISVRSNGPGKNSLCNYEHKQKFNAIVDNIHESLTSLFHVRNIKLSKWSVQPK